MKKVTALFLCIILAVCVFPVSAFADDEIRYGVFVNGVEFTSERTKIFCDRGNATFTKATSSDSPDILTLDGATITVSAANIDGIKIGNGELSGQPDELNIVLIGENTIKYTGTGYRTGIQSLTSNLSISEKGEGSLKIERFYTGISSSNGLTVNSGTIIVKDLEFGLSGEDIIINGGTIDGTGAGTTGIAAYQTMEIKGGEIKAAGRSRGIYAEEGLSVSGGTVTASAEGNIGRGINTYGDVTVSGGTVTASATGKNGSGINASGKVTVSGGTVNASATGENGIVILTEDFTVSDGKVNASATGENGNGINASGKVTVSGGTVITKGLSYGILINQHVYTSAGPNPPQFYGIAPIQMPRFIISGGTFVAEGTGEDGKAMSMLPDTADYKGFEWRSAKTAAYSKEALTDALLNERYFEIRKEAPFVYRPSAVVHQIGGAENPAVFGADNPAASGEGTSAASGEGTSTASGEENPNTGADFASIICGVAVLALAGAAMLRGKKH